MSLERDQIMAIGDNLNDLEMLEYAGQAVVMGNASPEIKDLAARRGWSLTASNDEDGVALAIEGLLLRRAVGHPADGNAIDEMADAAMVEFAQ